MTTLLLLHDAKTGIVVSVPTLLEAAGETASHGDLLAESDEWFVVNLTLKHAALRMLDHYLHASRGERHD